MLISKTPLIQVFFLYLLTLFYNFPYKLHIFYKIKAILLHDVTIMNDIIFPDYLLLGY